jgi:hypothetical protein
LVDNILYTKTRFISTALRRHNNLKKASGLQEHI